MNFICEQFDQYFTQKKFRSELQIYFFFFKIIFTFNAAISLRFVKDQRVYLHTCSFQPVLNGSFFFLGGAEDLFYHVKMNISRHVKNSLSENLVTFPVTVRAHGLTSAHRHHST